MLSSLISAIVSLLISLPLHRDSFSASVQLQQYLLHFFAQLCACESAKENPQERHFCAVVSKEGMYDMILGPYFFGLIDQLVSNDTLSEGHFLQAKRLRQQTLSVVGYLCTFYEFRIPENRKEGALHAIMQVKKTFF